MGQQLPGSGASGEEKIRRVSSKGILVVEDDPLVTEVITDIISSMGVPVTTAQDGVQAVSILEHCAKDFFCIILDFDIPGLHSSRVYSRLKQINHEIKVLLSSGYPASHIENDFPLDEIDGFIAKPYDPADLMRRLNSLSDDYLAE